MQNSIINETIIAVIGLSLALTPFAWLYWYLSLDPESEFLKKHCARKAQKPA